MMKMWGDGERSGWTSGAASVVLFPWDRKKATSCWRRVSQDWAGAGWGMVNIPRVGREVIVRASSVIPTGHYYGTRHNDQPDPPYALPTTARGQRSGPRVRRAAAPPTTTSFASEQSRQGADLSCAGRRITTPAFLNDSREWIGNNQAPSKRTGWKRWVKMSPCRSPGTVWKRLEGRTASTSRAS